MPVAIVADSICAPSRGLVNSLNIEIVPITIYLDGKTYLDMFELEPEQFYRLLPGLKEAPTTAAPPAGRYRECFARLLNDNKEVICFSVTSSLSTTCECARQGAESLTAEQGGKIEIVDTLNAGAASSLPVVEAARLARAGAPKEAILDRVNMMLPNLKLFGALDGLEHLKKSGRVGKLAALAGDFFRLKPVLYLHQGKAEAYARPRGKRQAIERMLEVFYRDTAGASRIWAAVTHAGTPEEARVMAGAIQARFPDLEIDLVPFTAAMGSHTGPGLVGIGYTYI